MITETTFLGLPMRTPAQRRAFVMVYYALLLLFATVGFVRNRRLPEALFTQTLIFGGLLGGIRPGGPVKAYAEPRFPLGYENDNRPLTLGLNAAMNKIIGTRYWTPLDERETEQRDRAHYRAYRILRWFFCISALTYALLWTWAPARLEYEAPLLAWLLLVVTLSLPQAVLLWTEPAIPGELTEMSGT